MGDGSQQWKGDRASVGSMKIRAELVGSGYRTIANMGTRTSEEGAQ